MSVASSSTLRALRRSAQPLALSVRHASTQETESSSSSSTGYVPYQPRPYSPNSYSSGARQPARPPRPDSPVFFTGKPILSAQIETIQEKLRSTQQKLRANNLYPLPRSLALPTPPEVTWRDRAAMQSTLSGEIIRHGEHLRMVAMLNELHRASYLADLGGQADLAAEVSSFLQGYATKNIVLQREAKKVKQLDTMGRARGAGKRKTASAQVWIIPSKSAVEHLDSQSSSSPSFEASTASDSTSSSSSTASIPSAEVLVNHLPLPKFFTRPQDRHAVLRPFKLTGLLGAYNVFAIVKGGGPTGQAEAVALGLARALVIMRPDTKAVLYADGALMRNPKMVERKKTNLLGARAARRWVKR